MKAHSIQTVVLTSTEKIHNQITKEEREIQYWILIKSIQKTKKMFQLLKTQIAFKIFKISTSFIHTQKIYRINKELIKLIFRAVNIILMITITFSNSKYSINNFINIKKHLIENYKIKKII